MGANVSSIRAIKENEYMQKLISPTPIGVEELDTFWNQFLAFAFSNLDELCSNHKFMEENVVPLLSTWLDNNLQSRNLGTAINVFLEKVAFLKASESAPSPDYNIHVWHAYNLLFIVRHMVKYLIETLPEEGFVANCQTGGTSGEDSATSTIESLLNGLIEILVDIQLDEQTYKLHVEACKSFIVLLSVQMFSARPSSKTVVYTLVMQRKCSIHALMLTKALLGNFQQQLPAPAIQSGSLIVGLASGIWNMVTWGYAQKKTDEELVKEAVLARESLLLLLVLANHCSKEVNPYREALFQCSDSGSEQLLAAAVVSASAAGDQSMSGFKINFSRLYRTLCNTLGDDQTTLLMYMMLHQNQHFKTFVLSRSTDLDQFVVPVLKILYNSPERNSHHIYMSLIILLVLSEDNLFNNIIHEIIVKNVTWYKEKQLNEVSLGGLIILVIVRTIHFNMTRSRDRFLHTNLCATLANMSNYFKHLSTYVCQKLVTLFDKLSKKYNKIVHHLELAKLAKQNGLAATTGDGDDGTSPAQLDSTISPDLVADFPVFEEVLRTILEIINACLTKNLVNNPNLVYTLLYNRKVFDFFLSIPAFQEIIINIETVLTFFSNRIEASEESLSVEEVFEIIKQSSLHWGSEKLKKFPELRFRYVEDEQPEDFFIPYIWSLVFRYSNIFWNPQNILLFNPLKN